MGEEHRGGESVVVNKVHETLARHAFPVAVAGDTFGGGAAPEERVFFFCKRGILGWGGVVKDFIDIIPSTWVKDVCVPVGFTLGKDGEKIVRIFKGGRGEVEAMEVGEVGLVAGGGRESPIAEKETMRVGRCAGGAVGAGMPNVGLASRRG